MFLPKTAIGFYWSVFCTKKWGVSAYLFFNTLHELTSYILPVVLVRYLVAALEDGVPGQMVLMDVMPTLMLLTGLIIIHIASDLIGTALEASVYPSTKKISHLKIYRYLIDRSVAFYKNHSSGYLAEQATAVINGTWRLLFKYPVRFFGIGLGVIANFGMLFSVDWVFAGLIGLILAFRVLHSVMRMGTLAESYECVSKTASVVKGKNIDMLSNFLNMKIFGDGRRDHQFLGEYYDEWVRAKENTLWLQLKFFAAPFVMEYVTLILLIFMLAQFYISGRIELSQATLVITSFISVRNCIVNLVWMIPDAMDDYFSAHQAYKDLTKTSPELSNVKTGARVCKYDSQIRFENVSFRYEKDWVLRDVTLCIDKGEKVGIVGPSGSGKTTLVNLLMHLYDVTDGRISIDGTDIKKFSSSSLKKVVSFVPQESILFNRTLAENISYGCGACTRADIIRAAKKAHAHDFIMRMDKGYDTIVGDRGVKLSGGQRQRISIAHAILKNSPILLLDEATSALDSETEAAIQKSLDTLMSGRTTIAIAHRLSTLKQMDRIIVMDHGRIIEQGTHASLMKKRGLYWRLWNLQYSGFM